MPAARSTEAAARLPKNITEKTRLSDGSYRFRWRISATRPDGQYERRSGTVRGTMRDAERAIREARAGVEKATVAPALKDMTVADLLTDFLRDRGPHLRPRTRENYASLTRLHLVPRLGALKVRALDAGTLQRFHRDLLETDLGRTRQLLHGVISQALDHGVVLGVLPHNPAPSVRVPPPPPPRRIRMEDEGGVMAFPPEIADRLHALALEDDTPHGFAVALALGLGMRRGEIYGLRLMDLDLKPRPDAPHGLLHVRQTLVTGGAVDRISPPKTRRSRRTLRMNEKARAAVDAALTWREAQARRSPGWTPCELMIVDENGNAERPNRARDTLNRLQRQMWAHARYAEGLPPATPDDPDPPLLPFHALRATFVSCAFEAGAKIEDISLVCGHVSSVVTETIYRRVFDRAAPLVRYLKPPREEGEEAREAAWKDMVRAPDLR